MKRLSFEVPEPTFDIVLAGDTHEGSVTYHKKGVDQLVDYLKEPHRFWVHMGDWVEAITTDDKRYAWNKTECPIPIKQAQSAVETFSPVASTCICGLIGNHELKLHRFGNLVQDIICKELNIQYGSYMAHVDIKHAGKKLFSMHLWHGPTKGSLASNAKDQEQRIANMKASLKMKLKYFFSDCAIHACGHFHRLFVVPPTNQLYIYTQSGKIKQGYLDGIQTGDYIDPDRRYYCCTGSFSKLYSDDEDAIGYAEISGYPPVELGFCSVHVVEGKITGVETIVV
jgi:hypothetical protein